MKRFLRILFSCILAFAVVAPRAASADSARTIEADSVLIYNPYPYDETAHKLYTGTLHYTEDDEPTPGKPNFTPGMHETGKDRTKATKDPTTHDFWVITNLTTYTYDKLTFRLAGGSEHCSIWALAEEGAVAFTDEQIQAMAEQFETVIYVSDTENFGPFRDLGGDGKLNIITYDMRSYSVCGFFDLYDLYSADEIAILDPDDADSYNCLPIINVNTRMAGKDAVVYGTLAHEFQHLILQSAVLASPANADRIGNELTPGVWLNEAFAMAAEELTYPGSVAEQGYLDSYASSQLVMRGMSLYNFDASSSDNGAYGQSYLFSEYLKQQCGAGVFRAILDDWRNSDDAATLSEAYAIMDQLDAAQIAELSALVSYTASVNRALDSDAEVLLSKINLAYRLAVLLQQEDGIFALGKEQPEMPVFEGSARRVEGGGALLIRTNGSFTIPYDADSGLVFVGIKDGAITRIVSVPEPEEGNYVLAACFDGEWKAIPAAPTESGYIRPITLPAPSDGVYYVGTVKNAVFTVTREGDGYRIRCADENGTYGLTRTANNQQSLSVGGDGTLFTWTHFADGTDRLQADGFTGRAILYGEYQHGFGYFPSAYFDNASFAKLQLIPVRAPLGDVNGDGKLTAADAAAILRYVVGLSEWNEARCVTADLNRDHAVTTEDAALALRIVLGLEPMPEE